MTTYLYRRGTGFDTEFERGCIVLDSVALDATKFDRFRAINADGVEDTYLVMDVTRGYPFLDQISARRGVTDAWVAAHREAGYLPDCHDCGEPLPGCLCDPDFTGEDRRPDEEVLAEIVSYSNVELAYWHDETHQHIAASEGDGESGPRAPDWDAIHFLGFVIDEIVTRVLIDLARHAGAVNEGS
jgi:hypothetical protein